jgi:hypothetical protein
MVAVAYRSAYAYRRQFLTYRGVLIDIRQGRRTTIPTGLWRVTDATGLVRTATPTGLDRTIYAP